MCFACALIMCLDNHGYHCVYHAEHWCLYTSRSRASGTIVPNVPCPPSKTHTSIFSNWSLVDLQYYFSPPILNYIFTSTYFPLLNFCQICRCNMVSCGFHLCPLECLRVWEKKKNFYAYCHCVFSPVKGLLMPFAHFEGNCFFLKYFLDLYAFRIGIVYEYYICNI